MAFARRSSFVWQPVEGGRVAFARRGAAVAPGSRSVVAIGAFDGLHLGHRRLLREACSDARASDVPCVAVTFDPDPAELMRGPAAVAGRRLLTCADRAAGLLALGADAVVSLAFDRALAGLGAREFVEDVLEPLTSPVALHVGTNFRFGSKGAGDVGTLAALGREAGFAVRAHELVSEGGVVVSATRVRRLLGAGSLAEANALLARCHYVRGVVEHGRGEGTSFGFPTANVRADLLDCMPPEGVYACYVACEGRAWPAAANVGAPPTFGGRDAAFLEANLLGFEGDLYGREVSVSFVRWLRGSRRFSSLEELERVVLGNIAWVAEHLGSGELEVRP